MTPDDIIKLIYHKAVDADMRREVHARADQSIQAIVWHARATTYAALADELRRLAAEENKQEAKP